jgi:hypothetical protein
MSTGSQAERLDHALDHLLAEGRPPRADGSLRPLLDVAALVRDALPPIPTSVRFDSRVLGRLGQRGGVNAAVDAVERFARRELRHPGRVVAAGAVSSAALGVTVTAVALWRSRRHAMAGALGAGRK